MRPLSTEEKSEALRDHLTSPDHTASKGRSSNQSWELCLMPGPGFSDLCLVVARPVVCLLMRIKPAILYDNGLGWGTEPREPSSKSSAPLTACPGAPGALTPPPTATPSPAKGNRIEMVLLLSCVSGKGTWEPEPWLGPSLRWEVPH